MTNIKSSEYDEITLDSIFLEVDYEINYDEEQPLLLPTTYFENLEL